MGVHSLMKKPIYYFQVQKGQAKSRGIPFELSYEEWWELWEPYWNHRGRGQDDYVMCRKGDTGAYVKGNVYIGKGRDNRLEAIKNMPRGEGHPRACVLDEGKIRELYSSGDYSWQALADLFETSKRTIGRILHKEHLPEKDRFK